MNYEEAIEAVERHRRHLVDRRAIDTVEVSIELADVCLKALRGWQAVEKFLANRKVTSVRLSQMSDFVACNVTEGRGLSGNGNHAFGHGPDPATAAIAAQEEA